MPGDRTLPRQRETAADRCWKEKLAECDHGWPSAIVVVGLLVVAMTLL